MNPSLTYRPTHTSPLEPPQSTLTSRSHSHVFGLHLELPAQLPSSAAVAMSVEPPPLFVQPRSIAKSALENRNHRQRHFPSRS
ncbi:uncharacterized protein DS421_15g489660 [Arachis hypogaea]|nr:uncharacterized protein DS421_15g489660 [Arachis hypogaea]